ncbi:DUF4837 family protein [Dokdonia sinensis]|uniref:DUF4837 family protein n=1 Tax=Dokdonia sinensis TaxID=2479847 RepID=A0A3M0FZL3_9FLAO|nr:DUF4837 family protein [Dokdonia sinensis]RMB57945.1 DUF4837 family protein [Dokdonia sinensis]
MIYHPFFKQLSVAFILVFLITACSEGEKKRTTARKLSSGRMNTINVVVENDAWKGAVGDSIRTVLAQPTLGLPVDEPIFTLKQLNHESFKGFPRENRLILYIQQGDSTGVVFKNDFYATPQTIAVVTGKDDAEVASLISENGSKIINELKAREISHRRNQISKSLKATDSLNSVFGLSLKFPTAYRYAAKEDNFFWMRKDLKNGDMNILVYEVPLKTIDQDTNTIARIIRMRDSVAGRKIPVDDGRFITQRDFAPYLNKTEIDGKPAWETRGLWEVDTDFLAGPFINYAIRDEENNRYVIIEGFIFSPSIDKRDNMTELEAILLTANLE